MMIELPDALRPLARLIVHIAIGSIALSCLVLIEVLLAGVLHPIALIPFAPSWLKEATDWLEQWLFWLDAILVGLFLITEIVKFCQGQLREIRDA